MEPFGQTLSHWRNMSDEQNQENEKHITWEITEAQAEQLMQVFEQANRSVSLVVSKNVIIPLVDSFMLAIQQTKD